METIIGLIFLALCVYAVVQIVQSSAETAMKIIWVLFVLVMPLIGLIAWYLLGPGGRKG